MAQARAQEHLQIRQTLATLRVVKQERAQEEEEEEVAGEAVAEEVGAEEQTQRCTPCTCASNQCLLRWHTEQAAQA